MNPTFPRTELQGSPIGQTHPMEEGGSLAVICQRTEEESSAVISWGPEQILRYRSDEMASICHGYCKTCGYEVTGLAGTGTVP